MPTTEAQGLPTLWPPKMGNITLLCPCPAVLTEASIHSIFRLPGYTLTGGPRKADTGRAACTSVLPRATKNRGIKLGLESLLRLESPERPPNLSFSLRDNWSPDRPTGCPRPYSQAMAKLGLSPPCLHTHPINRALGRAEGIFRQRDFLRC